MEVEMEVEAVEEVEVEDDEEGEGTGGGEVGFENGDGLCEGFIGHLSQHQHSPNSLR